MAQNKDLIKSDSYTKVQINALRKTKIFKHPHYGIKTLRKTVEMIFYHMNWLIMKIKKRPVYNIDYHNW